MSPVNETYTANECRHLWTVSTRTVHSPALLLAPGEGSSELSSRGGEVATSRASRRSVVAFMQIEAIGGEKAAVDFGGAIWAPHGPHGTRTRARTLRASCASFTRMHTWPRHARRFLHGRRPPDSVRARNVAGNRRISSVDLGSRSVGRNRESRSCPARLVTSETCCSTTRLEHAGEPPRARSLRPASPPGHEPWPRSGRSSFRHALSTLSQPAAPPFVAQPPASDPWQASRGNRRSSHRPTARRRQAAARRRPPSASGGTATRAGSVARLGRRRWL